MRKGSLVVAGTVFAVMLAPAAANGAVINVDVVGSGSDEAPPVGDGDCTLREAVDAARFNTGIDDCAPGEASGVDRINIPAGAVELAGAAGGDDNAGGDLDVTGGGPLEIAGVNAGETQVQAPSGDRAFDLLAGTTAITGIFGHSGNPTGAGGFIRVAGGATLNLTGSSLTGNIAAGGGGRGGAISGATDSNLFIHNSAIESNAAQAADASPAGGGIYSDGLLEVIDSDINANQATGNNFFSNGGGIAATGHADEGPVVTISGSRIQGNTTSIASGGGILLGKGFQSESYEISDTVISGNTGPNAGGGIMLFGGNSLFVDGSTFQDNHQTSVGTGGGAINAAQNNPTDKIVITDSALIDNDVTGTDSGAGIGGAAIRATQGELTIKRSLFHNNDVVTSSGGIIGGAIRTFTSTIEVENSTFQGNDILAGAENAAGGAIGIPGNGTARLVHATIGPHTVTGSGTAVFAQNNSSVELHGSLVDGDCVTGTTGSPVSSASSFNVVADTTCNQGTDNLDPPDLGIAAGPAANGGPTDTIALDGSSPARDFVSVGDCDDLEGDPLATDQRGVPRPYKKRCDAGAYEYAKCGGVLVNVVGDAKKNKLLGGSGPDGALGLGGKDVLKGADGTDGLCGGAGGDKLVGGPGGGDVCNGGPGHDRASGTCERKLSIP